MLLKPKYQIVIAGLCLAIVAILSLMIGNTLVSPGTVIQALFNFDSENDLHDVVTGARASRTIIALLTGAAIAMLFTAFTQGILIMNETDLQGLLFWLSGSVSLRNIWDIPWIIPLVLILILIAFSMAAHINILMTSDDIATGLGQNIKLIKWMIIMLISMLAGISVAVAGSIVFVGLIVPNISKRLLPPNYKYLIPFTALAGAILMIISDIVARIIIKPLELPIGVVTAVIGAIVLIYIMKKGRQRL
ncbi:iron ABC transporter permease [Staphylococcus aureus]|nr:iron ABC transporter permease [Staphylococcus aureus]